MGKESYDDLIFQLGDLARDRLAGKPNCPRSMDRVYRAEDALVARRDELASIEQRLNGEDTAWQEFQAQQAEERIPLQETVKKWKKAVDAISGQVRDIRSKLSSKRADLRYAEEALAKMEERHQDMELAQTDESKLSVSRDNIKKSRLKAMRLANEVESVDYEIAQLLTPKPGQAGAPGILAHKRLLEMEDAAEKRKAEHEKLMAELEQGLADKEAEIQAAEDYLDQALYLLGEEVYALRISDAQLAPFYPRLDKVRK